MAQPQTIGHHLTETSIGWIGVGWSLRGLNALCLPGGSRAATGRALVARVGQAPHVAEPPRSIAELVEKLQAYASGARVDFSGVPVDLDGVEPFRTALYAALRDVGYGETLTYGELAARVGRSGAAREIGQAMGRNPVPIVVPCHRVTAAGGKLGGFSAPGGADAKRRLLMLERAAPHGGAQSAFRF